VKDGVGPVLRMCDELELVIRALQDDNPAESLEVIDRGAYVRVQRPEFLRLTLASLQRHCGADFQLVRIESIVAAFAGRIRTSSDEIVWHLQASAAGRERQP
jgi:toluene monooxygenase system protein D